MQLYCYLITASSKASSVHPPQLSEHKYNASHLPIKQAQLPFYSRVWCLARLQGQWGEMGMGVEMHLLMHQVEILALAVPPP